MTNEAGATPGLIVHSPGRPAAGLWPFGKPGGTGFSLMPLVFPISGIAAAVVGQTSRSAIGVKISYAELRLVGEDCWPASGILMNCAGDRDSPRFVSIAKRPCLGRRRVAPTASYEIETRRYADT